MEYSFNDFTLDTDCFELRRDGKAIAAEPQVLELIAFLLEHRLRLVSKQEILEAVWKNRIVSDSALSSRIKKARQVLGDDGHTQAIIRTVHGKGFRFVADVTKLAVLGNGSLGANQPCVSQPKGGETAQYCVETKKPSVAVLPFSNLSSDPEQEYFSDGITADIIANLAKHKWLKVLARNTTFLYKNQTLSPEVLANKLGVKYLVEGSVQKSGNTLRISAFLIDAETGFQKWADKYDRALGDIFKLQDEITQMIVGRLEPEIGFSERNRVALSRPKNLQAWDCYHLGVHHFFKFTGNDNIEAQRLLKHSQALDKNFGEAYSWWAYAVILGMVYWSTKPEKSLLDDALTACNKALALDNQNASFYALKARVLLARCEYSEAIAENKQAIKINPTFAAAHCGLGDSFAYEERYDEAIECFERAINMSPNDPQLWAFYTYGALAYIFKEDYQRAIEWAEKAYRIPNCQYWTLAHMLVAHSLLNNEEQVRRCKKLLFEAEPSFSLSFAREKLFYIKSEKQLDLYIKGLCDAGLS